ncbi:MAG: alpha/beta hydrolase fold domain-containing protein [Bryobacterales bacterium]|nr:alpha/beta hydrolase fold domain-containing protein [Bryobacterales bacterium]
MLIHGGGWEGGSRAEVARFIPYFTERRCVVANIGYRLTPEAVAPAAAEDVRNAIESVRARAAQWHADSGRMLLVGFSAGAHLALLAALAPPDAIGGPQCRARAVLSFWGVTDVVDLLSGENERAFARRWLPEGPERLELARRLSPMQYDAAGAPALYAAHSVHDHIVPFAQSQRLVARFQRARVPAHLNRLSHWGHTPSPEEYPAIFSEAFRFLAGIGVLT